MLPLLSRLCPGLGVNILIPFPCVDSLMGIFDGDYFFCNFLYFNLSSVVFNCGGIGDS